jgi:hypothetical protein
MGVLNDEGRQSGPEKQHGGRPSRADPLKASRNT